MAIYKYVKAYPKTYTRKTPLLSYSLMLIGICTLIWVGGPIFSFWIFTSPYLVQITTPLPEFKQAAGQSVPIVLSTTTETSSVKTSDYTNPNTWFPAKPQKNSTERIPAYTISIPKLNITDAHVTVGGDDLSKSLIHYGGTALPGDYGNTVIFGHSTLIQFFNPKNYTTIFSTLPTLKKGDSIYVKSDGVQYRYVVYDMTVADPSDLSALEQKFDQPYLTLITCVPPGTYLKRLNVKARLEKYVDNIK